MPSEEYAKKSILVTFPTAKECREWQDAAAKTGLPYSKYLLEMARRGRAAETSRPGPEAAADLAAIRAENTRLLASVAELRALYERAEADVFALRYRAFGGPLVGSQQPSEKLVELLRSSVRPMPSEDLLRALSISPQDLEAMRILKGQLEALQSFGLLQETPMGWRWVR